MFLRNTEITIDNSNEINALNFGHDLAWEHWSHWGLRRVKFDLLDVDKILNLVLQSLTVVGVVPMTIRMVSTFYIRNVLRRRVSGF